MAVNNNHAPSVQNNCRGTETSGIEVENISWSHIIQNQHTPHPVQPPKYNTLSIQIRISESTNLGTTTQTPLQLLRSDGKPLLHSAEGQTSISFHFNHLFSRPCTQLPAAAAPRTQTMLRHQTICYIMSDCTCRIVNATSIANGSDM